MDDLNSPSIGNPAQDPQNVDDSSLDLGYFAQSGIGGITKEGGLGPAVEAYVDAAATLDQEALTPQESQLPEETASSLEVEKAGEKIGVSPERPKAPSVEEEVSVAPVSAPVPTPVIDKRTGKIDVVATIDPLADDLHRRATVEERSVIERIQQIHSGNST